MKAITLHQPYATLIATGHKQIETRSWAPAYRGPLAIHAAASIPAYAIDAVWQSEAIRRALGYIPSSGTPDEIRSFLRRLPLGKIVATCELSSCPVMDEYRIRRVRDLRGDEIEFGLYAPGRYAWMLENVTILETPVPVKGLQGLWNWTPEAA